MNQLGILPVLFFSLVFIWLGAVTYFLYKMLAHYNSLTKATKRETLTSVLEQLLEHARANHQTITSLQERIDKQEKKSELQIQKIGLVRYNPFADTGGEQSFVVSLLDNHSNGMILTSLQGRSGTRWYAKQVKRGKGLDFQLSKEEEEAVKKAKALS